MKQRPPVKIVTATEAKDRFDELIKGAYLREEHLIVTRDGIPVVAIVSMAAYAQLVSPEDLAAELGHELAASSADLQARAQLAAFLADVHARVLEVPEEEAEREIAQAIDEVRGTA